MSKEIRRKFIKQLDMFNKYVVGRGNLDIEQYELDYLNMFIHHMALKE